LKRKHRHFLIKHNLITLLIAFFVVFTAIVFFYDTKIENIAEYRIFNSVDKIPTKKVAVLLGTEKKFKNGELNQLYFSRINAVCELYKAKKINVIIISRNQGNVIDELKEDLIKKGIPKNKIILDYAGTRTYDSMYRIYKVYGQKDFIVIAQNDQNERAIYIAKKHGLSAIAYNAKEYTGYNSFRLNMIEKLERTRLFFEFMFKKKPNYSGERVKVKF